MPVIIEIQPQQFLEVKENESFTIFCKASSNPEPCYQWFHDNTKLDGETSNILHVCKCTTIFFLHQNNINVMNFFCNFR